MVSFLIAYLVFFVGCIIISTVAIKVVGSPIRWGENKKVTVGELCILTLLSSIPVVNIVVFFVSALIIAGSYKIMSKELF